MTLLSPDPATARAVRAARESFRRGLVTPTAGIAPGFTQCNMISRPRDWAWDLPLYAQRNPKACPVLDVTDPGSHRTALAEHADLVTFLIGCSFTFETPMQQAGIEMRHIAAGRVAEAAMISGRTPAVHGEAVDILDGEVPVFWACGVTPQAALIASKPPFAITHAPGHMFIADVPDTHWQV